jgi:peptidoglycan hydrolase-like protein with peptidoglycan-binding domain
MLSYPPSFGTGRRGGRRAGGGRHQGLSAPEAAAPAGDIGAHRTLSVQKALNVIGYGPVPEDGIANEDTIAAIRRFELDNGLPVTGAAGDTLIQRPSRSGRWKRPERMARVVRLWVAAHVRRCNPRMPPAVVMRRGAERPARSSSWSTGSMAPTISTHRHRRWPRRGPAIGPAVPEVADRIDGAALRDRIGRELRFDPDLWVVAIEDRGSRLFLETV